MRSCIAREAAPTVSDPNPVPGLPPVEPLGPLLPALVTSTMSFSRNAFVS